MAIRLVRTIGENGAGVADYLRGRGVGDKQTLGYFMEHPVGFIDENRVESGGFSCSVSHFLGVSKSLGCDIRDVNEAVGLDRGELVIFAIADGDDPICLDTKTGKVLLLVHDGDTVVELSRSFAVFIATIEDSQLSDGEKSPK